MAERPEDLNLPNAVVTRIIKDAIPDGVNVSKEARLAISKAASVFVLYATSCSNNFALKNKRKTINAQDVMSAMEDMEFEQFIEPLLQCQEAFLHDKKEKKKEKIIKNLPAIQQPSIEEGNEVEEVSDEEDKEGESSAATDSRKAKGKEVVDAESVSKEDQGSGSSPEMMEDTGE